MNDDGRKRVPVLSDEISLTVGPDVPILPQDHSLIEQMANFNRKRIPECQPYRFARNAMAQDCPLAAREAKVQGSGQSHS